LSTFNFVYFCPTFRPLISSFSFTQPFYNIHSSPSYSPLSSLLLSSPSSMSSYLRLLTDSKCQCYETWEGLARSAKWQFTAWTTWNVVAVGAECVSSPPSQHRLCGSPSIQFSAHWSLYWGKSKHRVKLTTMNLVQRLRTRRTSVLLPNNIGHRKNFTFYSSSLISQFMCSALLTITKI
jgi:hypothetical protein